jgi:prepilin-type N-terminal cleavage/methylation domain-containing protein
MVNKKGFTLIETVMTIGIATIIIGVVGSFVVYSYRSINSTLGKTLAINNAKKIINTFSRELREAIQADDGSYVIAAAEDFEITFYSDIDTDDDVEKIRYFLEDNKMKKEVTNPVASVYGSPDTVKTISSYIQNTTGTPLFYFYDRDYRGQATGTPLTTPVSVDNISLIRLIGMKVILDADVRNINSMTLETKAKLRNLE